MSTRSPSLHRRGTRALLDVGGTATLTAEGRLDEIGSGFYSWVLILCIGGAGMAESMEMGSVAPIHSSLARTFGLSHSERSALPLITFGGSAIGLLLAGPFCDWRGRKEALLLSLVTISAVMFITATLPNDTSPVVVLFLRFLSGMAGAVQAPAGCVLAVESSPAEARSRIVFGICVMGALGYLIEAFAIQHFMPNFGEEPTDHWRAYCYMVGGASLCTMPLMYWLQESPCFLAVNGDAEGCVQALDAIACFNGKPPISPEAAQQLGRARASAPAPAPAPAPARSLQRRGRGRSFVEVADAMKTATNSWVPFLLILLSLLDSCRAFMVSGSSYLWKDLFMMVDGQLLSPAWLNVISSIAPIVALLISVQLIWVGVRHLAFLSAMFASLSFAALLSESVRLVAGRLLLCIFLVKSTYGPLGTCVNLIKAESFPTELRASAFAVASVVAKITGSLSPTLVEALKTNETAQSWNLRNLHGYIVALLMSTVIFALLILLVPGQNGEGKSLRDYVKPVKPSMGTRVASYGTLSAWVGSDSDSDHRPVMKSVRTMPNLCA